ncbi:hypothetical protein OBBRIDRAFT_793831 [Obba rivulosa]|uniref:Uncharacterized protein n=1 Tax=Obba rivulosa TaxID=1052685 RepID=A0A8E2DJ21_9APHY|nr:hypothetical protein OBBRIDRAFT_793831 [Obba rivulosa]
MSDTYTSLRELWGSPRQGYQTWQRQAKRRTTTFSLYNPADSNDLKRYPVPSTQKAHSSAEESSH